MTLKGRAFALKNRAGQRNRAAVGIIQDTIAVENEKLTRKMSLAEFHRLISGGAPTKDIIAEIRARASVIYEAEHPVEEIEVRSYKRGSEEIGKEAYRRTQPNT